MEVRRRPGNLAVRKGTAADGGSKANKTVLQDPCRGAGAPGKYAWHNTTLRPHLLGGQTTAALGVVSFSCIQGASGVLGRDG